MSKFSTERQRLTDKLIELGFRHARIKARSPHSEKLDDLWATLQETQKSLKALGIPDPVRPIVIPLKKDGES